MQSIVTIGLDIAKSVFQVHGVDAGGQVLIRRQLKRRQVLAFFEKLPPCLIGIEACASAHHWSRELQALGHTVRLMPPAYVKPYVKRQKNDMADAEAICEAVARANMRFVPTKTPEQQSCLMLHRTRHLFIRQQTALINSIRAHLAEFGIVAPVGRKGVTELLRGVADPNDKRVSEVARVCLAALGSQLLALKQQILEFDRMIPAWHRSNQTSKRLHYIPGVGPMLATALVASVADPSTFRSARNFSAWIGLVPKQHSSGGKERLGSISKQGDRYLRSLFVAGALAVIRYAKIHGTKHRPWLTALLARKPTKVAAVAIEGSKGYTFLGEHIYEQSKASAINACATTPRPGSLRSAFYRLPSKTGSRQAIKLLVQIDEYRKGRTINETGHCIFEFGSAYVQFRAPNYADYLICEAVSGKLSPDIATILTPEKMDRLLLEFGFIAPGRSPNFAQRIEIKSKPDLAYATRLAYRVLRDIYDVKDFGVTKFKVYPAKAIALSVPEARKPTTQKFILTIDKQLLTLKLNAILALFGKARTIEFAEGKWTPFVSFELEAPPNDMPTVQRIDFTNMSGSEIVASLNSLPKDVTDFAGFVRDEIEKIETVRSDKK